MEGKFDVNGDDFSESAKNVRLLNNVLHATLVTSYGVWWDDQIAIEVDLQPGLGFPSVSFRPCDIMRLKGCRYLRLIDGRFLACQILQGDLSYQDAYMDLNGCLENENGMF